MERVIIALLAKIFMRFMLIMRLGYYCVDCALTSWSNSGIMNNSSPKPSRKGNGKF